MKVRSFGKFYLLCLGILLCRPDLAVSVEDSARIPKNLNRAQLGARWLGDEKRGLDSSGDPSRWTGLPKGISIATLDLGDSRVLDRLSFQHRGLTGSARFEMASLIQGGDWQSVGEVELSDDRRTVEVSLVPGSGKYFRLIIDSKSGGAMRGLGLFGPLRVSDVDESNASKDGDASTGEAPLYNLAVSGSNSNIIETSSREEEAFRLRDEDVGSVFSFARDDAQPSLTLDLGVAAKVGRVVILHSEAKGEWRVLSDGEGIETPVPRQDFGASVLSSLGTKARQIRLTWHGEIPEDGPMEVLELAVFLEAGGQPREDQIRRNPYFGEPGFGNVGSQLESTGSSSPGGSNGLPDIQPASR